jgi:hypothetical protein
MPFGPAFSAKLRINYLKTWAAFTRVIKNLRTVAPDATPEHLRAALAPQKTIKRPQIKGNVVHTAKEILTIFLDLWKRAPKAINLAIRTTRAGLAKRCQNRDPKTAYRHILALVDAGILRAKVHVKGGLQLLLNPALIVFDAAPAQALALAPASPVVAPAAPACTPEQGMAALRALAQNFGLSSRRHP